jgi:tetratricopeptide (TPR) repeat protein
MLRSERFDDAVTVLQLNTIRHPESWRTWDVLGDSYRAKGDRELAIQSYAKSLELNPDNIYVQRRLQDLRFHSTYDRGGLDEAIRLYRQAREENPRAYDEGTMNSIGYAFLREGKKSEAIEVFKLNTEAYPESWNVWDSLAEAYMESGDTKLAIRYYEKSLELNPANENGRKMLRRIRNEN